MNDEDEADDIAEYIRRPRFWRLLSVNDPYRFDYQITEKTTQRFIARESLDPLVTLRVQEEDGKYTLSAGIQMTYMCRSADGILDSFWFADVAPSDLLELKEMLGEYGDTVCDIRYLDSRYYQKYNKVEY